MPPLINKCSLWVNRLSPWWHWSFVHQILFWIEIGLKLVEKDGFEFSFLQHWSWYQSTITESLQIRMPPLISICSFSEYQHWPWRHWSRGHRILCWIEISLKMVEQDGLEFLLEQHWSCSSPQQAPKFYTPSWWPIWSIYVHSENIDIRHDGIALVDIEY